jgi:succinate dehydrogenase / fumarate reductase flavoprotein subunit
MQGLADGYFVVPYTVGDHLAKTDFPKVSVNHPAFKETLVDARDRLERILSVKGRKSVDMLHRELGHIMWSKCGMARSADGLKEAASQIRTLRDEFWRSVKVLGTGEALNQNLEHAGRVADFLEFAELFAQDALHRNESCGGHFREEYQTAEGDTKRDDENFCYVAAWEFNGPGEPATLHKENLTFNEVPLTTRSYK